jgi:seryl-tRNA synthetase
LRRRFRRSSSQKIRHRSLIPTQGKRELTCSNCTDFQARRSQMLQNAKGENNYTHTLNGTAIAISHNRHPRKLPNEDGSVTVPVLRPFMAAWKDQFEVKRATLQRSTNLSSRSSCNLVWLNVHYR